MSLTQLQTCVSQYGTQILRDLTTTLLNVTPQSTIEAHSRLRRAIDEGQLASDTNPSEVYISIVDTHKDYFVPVLTAYANDPVMASLLSASPTIALHTALLLCAFASDKQSLAMTVYASQNGVLQRL